MESHHLTIDSLSLHFFARIIRYTISVLRLDSLILLPTHMMLSLSINGSRVFQFLPWNVLFVAVWCYKFCFWVIITYSNCFISFWFAKITKPLKLYTSLAWLYCIKPHWSAWFKRVEHNHCLTLIWFWINWILLGTKIF